MSWEKQLFKDSVLSIAQGEVNGHSGQHKFGAVPSMSQNHTGTIWDVNDTRYPWGAWDAGPLIIQVVPASSGDIEKSVVVEGLDENWNLISETITTDSSPTPIGNSVNQFRRVFRAYAASDSLFLDDVAIQRAGTTVAYIPVSNAQTLMAIYTVPAGYTAYLTQGTASCQANADATVSMFVRYAGELSFRIGHSLEVSGAGGQYNYNFSVPLRLPEKTDIDVRATVRSNNARVTAAFDMILVQDGYEHV